MKFLKYIMLLTSMNVAPVMAVTGVNPSGVNVSHSGPSSVFLTFQNLSADERAVESFWCGEVTTTAVSNTNPCVPGTVFGRLPEQLNISRNSQAGAFRNFTDIMTIPSAVTRKAFQDARNGNPSDFFYVRRFSSSNANTDLPTAADTYVVVTCRMAGGGARVPLALMDVQVQFLQDDGPKDPVRLLQRGEQAAPLTARILYNGSGRLRGRWEVVLPGDPEPSQRDLLTEASLPIEERGTQRQYTVLGHFDLFLPPTGQIIVPGPDPRNLPNQIDGLYKVLLRIQASRDKEGNSDTGAGVVASGGVAGFPMPVLRYYVASQETLSKIREATFIGQLRLLEPVDNAVFDGYVPTLSWVAVPEARLYRVEILHQGELYSSSIVSSTQLSYVPPPWLKDDLDKNYQWRVVAIDKAGVDISTSREQVFTVKARNAE